MTFTKGRDVGRNMSHTRQSWRWGWSSVSPLPSLFSLLGFLFLQILTLAFLTLLSCRAQFVRNLLWGQPLGHPWLYDTMVVCQALHFPLSGLLSHFLSLVCVFILCISLFLPISHHHPRVWTLWPQGSFLSFLSTMGLAHILWSVQSCGQNDSESVCISSAPGEGVFFFFFLKLDSTKQILSWGGMT